MWLSSAMRKLLMAAFLLLLGNRSALGSAVDVGAPVSNNGVLGLTSGEWLADQFSLSNSTSISSIMVGIADFGGNPADYTLSIVDSLSAGSTPEFTSGPVPPTMDTFIPSGLTLAAGTYYLAAEVTSTPSGDGWFQSTGTFTEIGGTVTKAYWITNDQGTTWTEVSGANPFVFDVQGTSGASVVPESGTLVLFGSGLISMLGFMRRRKL